MCSKDQIFVKKSWHSHIIECIYHTFQEHFTKINYLNYFLSNIVIEFYKQEKTYLWFTNQSLWFCNAKSFIFSKFSFSLFYPLISFPTSRPFDFSFFEGGGNSTLYRPEYKYSIWNFVQELKPAPILYAYMATKWWHNQLHVTNPEIRSLARFDRAKWPKSKQNGPNPSKMAHSWSESRYWRPHKWFNGPKWWTSGQNQGFLAWFGQFCLD